MKVIFLCMLLSLVTAHAIPNLCAFDQWDIVAIINVEDGKVTTLLLHFSDKAREGMDADSFRESVVKWAAPLKGRSLVYAMCYQKGKQKSATWEISRQTSNDMTKIFSRMKDANVKPGWEK